MSNRKYIFIHGLGGGFMFLYFHPYLGKWSNLTNIFSDGLKTPTSGVFSIVMLQLVLRGPATFPSTFFVFAGLWLEERDPVMARAVTNVGRLRWAMKKTRRFRVYIGDYTTQVYREDNKPL